MKIMRRMGLDPMSWFLGDKEVAKALLQLTILVCQLNDSEQIARAFYEIMTPIRKKLPKSFLIPFFTGKISSALLAKELKTGMKIFAGKFIAGHDIPSISKTIRAYKKKGFGFTIDVLSDLCLSEKEAHDYIESYDTLITALPQHIGNENLSASIKIYAAYSQMDKFSPQYSIDMICERFDDIFKKAERLGWHIYLDALERDYRNIHLGVFKKAYRRYGSTIRFVEQSYFPDSENVLNELARLRADAGADLWVRLVSGAYHSYEQHVASHRAWHEAPVYTRKEHTVENFKFLFRKGLGHNLTMVGGTHNADLIAYCIEMWAELFGKLPPVQQLIYGMGEDYGDLLRDLGVFVLFYMPVVFGFKSFEEALGYLMRRVDDNTGPASFIREYFFNMIVALITLEKRVREAQQNIGRTSSTREGIIHERI